MTRRDPKKPKRATPKRSSARKSGRHNRLQLVNSTPPIVAEVAEMLREPTPFDLLLFASSMIETATPRPADEFFGTTDRRPDGPEIFENFGESEWPPLVMLAAAVAILVPDLELAQRIQSHIDPDIVAQGPTWLSTMSQIQISGAWQQTHPLGDGDQIFIGMNWPDGTPVTAVVMIDHNRGTLLADAVVVPAAPEVVLADLVQFLQDEDDDGHYQIEPLDGATARARLEQTIDRGEEYFPPLSSDSWPDCRPFLEWIVGHLPSGGAGYATPSWTEPLREAILTDFLASPFAEIEGVDASDVRGIAAVIIEYGCDQGPNDPLRWSPELVHRAMTQWLPDWLLLRTYDADAAPEILEAFIRFAHQRREIPSPLTDQTVAEIDEELASYYDVLDAQYSVEGDDGADDEAGLPSSDEDYEAFLQSQFDGVEQFMIDRIGGADAYAMIDDQPLGDIAFDWSRIPDPLREPTEATLALVDRWSEEFFDLEMRSMARVVLAAVIEADRSVFARSARADTFAAGLLGALMGILLDVLRPEQHDALGWSVVNNAALARATDVTSSSVNARAKTIRGIIEDRAEIDWSEIIHSAERRLMMELRDEIAELRVHKFDS